MLRREVAAVKSPPLPRSVYALDPAFGESEVVEIGTQLRPAFAANLPQLHRRGDTLFVNGLFRHGFLIAPALARRVADMLIEGRTFPEVAREGAFAQSPIRD